MPLAVLQRWPLKRVQSLTKTLTDAEQRLHIKLVGDFVATNFISGAVPLNRTLEVLGHDASLMPQVRRPTGGAEERPSRC